MTLLTRFLNHHAAVLVLLAASLAAIQIPSPGAAMQARTSRLIPVRLPGGLHSVESRDVSVDSRLFESAPIDCGIEADQFIISWNTSAALPHMAGIKVEARAIYPSHITRYYCIANWSLDNSLYPRESTKDQKDADGDVWTDTLALNKPARLLQLRITEQGVPASAATTSMLKLLTVCASGLTTSTSDVAANTHKPNRPSGEISVPGRTQLGWPDAAGWCSPTSTAMVLAFWANRLQRPELDVPVPEAAHSIYDPVYNGTGNWPFNTAFAGSFPGITAFVSRLSSIGELEKWPNCGLPIVVSVSYDLLKGKDKAQDAGHLMVCVGFTAEGDIVLNDPAHHPELGEPCRRVFSRANFIKAWANSHNTVYIIYPEGTHLPADPEHHWSLNIHRN